MENNMYTTQLVDIVVAGRDQSTINNSLGVFIVMDYTEGDLQNIVNNPQNFEIEEEHLKVIMNNSLNAINFIHHAGIMHRDLKPANILMNQECYVQICDFGLARGCLDKKTVKGS